jgi:arylsulfatase A-like enzyme
MMETELFFFRRCLCGYEFCYDCGRPYRTCDCQEMEQQDFYRDFAAEQEEDFEETIRAPLPPWDRDHTIWLPVGTDTEAHPDAYNTNELPAEEAANELPEEEEEEVDSSGTVTEDGEVFGPLSEATWKRIDRFREI